MPNWCMNVLTIYGGESKTAPVCESMKGVLPSDEGNSETPFSFHSVIPQPDFLLDENDPRRTGKPPKSSELLASLSNTDQRVMPDWYTWRCDKWGTKWDISPDNIFVEKRARSVMYSFETAWSPPHPVIAALSAKFPTVKMMLRFREEGMGFKGSITFLGGQVVSATGDGEEAYEFDYGGETNEPLVECEMNPNTVSSSSCIPS